MRSNRLCLGKKRRKSGINVWTIIGGALLAITAFGLITSWKDIARYMKIRSM